MRRILFAIFALLICLPELNTPAIGQEHISCDTLWEIPKNWVCEHCQLEYRLDNEGRLHIMIQANSLYYSAPYVQYIVLSEQGEIYEQHDLSSFEFAERGYVNFELWKDHITLFYPLYKQQIFQFDRRTKTISPITLRGISICVSHDRLNYRPTQNFIPMNDNEILICTSHHSTQLAELNDITMRPVYLSGIEIFNVEQQKGVNIIEIVSFQLFGPWERVIIGRDERIYVQTMEWWMRNYHGKPYPVPLEDLTISQMDIVILSRAIEDSEWTISSIIPHEKTGIFFRDNDMGKEILYPVPNELMLVDTASKLYFFDGGEPDILTKIDLNGNTIWQITSDDLGVASFRFVELFDDDRIVVATAENEGEPRLTIRECRVDVN